VRVNLANARPACPHPNLCMMVFMVLILKLLMRCGACEQRGARWITDLSLSTASAPVRPQAARSTNPQRGQSCRIVHAQPVNLWSRELVGEPWAGVHERLIHTSVARTVGGV
jgi:hypothetical protein